MCLKSGKPNGQPHGKRNGLRVAGLDRHITKKPSAIYLENK